MGFREPTGSEKRRTVERKLRSLLQAGVTHLPKGRSRKGSPSPSRGATSAQTESPAADQMAIAARPSAVEPGMASECPRPDAPTNRAEPAASRVASLNALARKVASCTRCAELARTRTQTVFGAGNPQPRLVFMGEAPGAEEDMKGEPFVGRAGQLLTDIITKGMKLRREDVYILNTIKCRPPGNRTPLPDEAANCREFLDGQLAILQPEFVCCLGAVASQNLLGTSAPIGQLRGRLHDYQGMKVLCTYHPAYVLRYPATKRQVWEDIQILMKAMGLMP